MPTAERERADPRATPSIWRDAGRPMEPRERTRPSGTGPHPASHPLRCPGRRGPVRRRYSSPFSFRARMAFLRRNFSMTSALKVWCFPPHSNPFSTKGWKSSSQSRGLRAG